MPVTISIPDANMVGFSQPAKDQLEDTVEHFANDLISEANRLEASHRTPADAPDVNAQMIRDASTFVRKAMIPKPASIWIKLSRVASAIMSLFVGVAWDKSSLQDSIYLLGFGSLFAITLIAVTFVTIKD